MSKPRSGAPKRVAAGLLAGALSVAGIAFAPTASAVEDVTTDRLAGATRYGTAAEISAHASFDGATTAILATGENFPDALAASGLAGTNAPAPIVLTTSDALSEEALAALDDLGVTDVIIVGGTAAVSDDVADTLTAEGYDVSRSAGTDRYGTAADIASDIGTAADHNGLATAVIATGLNFPDALAGGPISYVGGFPLLLVNAGVPAETEAALESLGVEQTILLGGTAAISTAVENELETITGNDAIRLAGVNRNGTAVEVAEFGADNGLLDWDTVLLAYGRNFPDALAGGPLGGELTAPILLTSSVPAETAAALDEHSDEITELIALGGTAVISDETLAEAEALAENTDNDGPVGSATIRPELVSASIVETVTPANATPTKPAGTYVRYTFDEAVGTAAANVPASFKVYNADSTVADQGDSATTEPGGMSVVVRFDVLDTAVEAARLSVATVIQGAVTDASGNTNPEGDAAIGSGSTSTLTAGQTTAPDLLSVGGFRQAANAGQTAVDFTFDEAAQVANVAGFSLVSTANGVIVCYASNVPTDPSGGTVPGGSGTTVITVVCDNPNITAENPGGTPLSTANVARGAVDAGTVQDTTADANPLQIAEAGNGGNTSGPDLVSVTFNQGTGTNPDTALFVFDTNVTAFDATLFNAYRSNSDEVSPAAAGDGAISATDPKQVLVTFPSSTSLDDAVGASVEPGAVTTASGTNERDEVPVTNSNATTVTPGKTAAPDLIGVAVAATTGFVPARAQYTFDANVAPAPVDTSFVLYLADGTRITSTACARGTSSASTDSATSSAVVTCEFGLVTDSVVNSQVVNSVLGTVLAGAVQNEGATVTNPEGAEFTSGGTGTRTA